MEYFFTEAEFAREVAGGVGIAADDFNDSLANVAERAEDEPWPTGLGGTIKLPPPRPPPGVFLTTPDHDFGVRVLEPPADFDNFVRLAGVAASACGSTGRVSGATTAFFFDEALPPPSPVLEIG